ncbi:membrane associated protein [Gordonia sp. QH-12]|uniref:hypothetical protein n=1 Tax=Gordonia sp. QH-12 TaxID=1437876 RepID=UPI00078413AD|nr:hypothetical protein [Gordonia sp. QH-12]KXT56811.1 membrane associated protein [Gordonia sp. QH-12]
MFVLTADQRGSRTGRDRVPEVLARSGPGMIRPFERTAGDEVQAVFDSPDHLAVLAVDLAASGDWSVGIGVGTLEAPLPPQTRAGRGQAFLDARDAVEAAKKNRWHLCVRGVSPWCDHAQTAAWLLLDVLLDRSEAGREAVSLVAAGSSQSAAADALGISPQAMSLRLRHARWDVQRPAEELFRRLLQTADGVSPLPEVSE